MPSDLPAEAASSPIILYVLIGTGVGAILLGFFPKILPPLAKVLEQRAAIRKAGEDRRFSDMQGQIDYLQNELATVRAEAHRETAALRSELHDHRTLASAHVAWDYNAVTEAVRHGYALPDPLPLFTPVPPDEKSPPTF